MTEQRSPTLDIAKGIAIIAIVAGHVWRGLATARIIETDSFLFISVDRTLYMFHLSVFAFAAGLFVQRGMRRNGPWTYARDRNFEFIWLYILWTTIQISVKLLTSQVVNTPAQPEELLTLWVTKEQFWFFGWIAVMMILAALFEPWRSKLRLTSSNIMIAILSLATWGLNGPYFGTEGHGLTVFFWAGLILTGPRVLKLIDVFNVKISVLTFTIGAVLLICLSVFTEAIGPTSGGADRTVLGILLGAVASTCGVVAVLAYFLGPGGLIGD